MNIKLFDDMKSIRNNCNQIVSPQNQMKKKWEKKRGKSIESIQKVSVIVFSRCRLSAGVAGWGICTYKLLWHDIPERGTRTTTGVVRVSAAALSARPPHTDPLTSASFYLSSLGCWHNWKEPLIYHTDIQSTLSESKKNKPHH